MRPELQLATPTPTTFAMTREFDAPPARVFDALTKPELISRWLGAYGWNVAECSVDLRVGGTWHHLHRGPGDPIGHGGEYREIEAPRRLVYTETYDDHWFPGGSLVTAELSGQDNHTVLTTTIEYESEQVRDFVLASPMKTGVAEGYERLDAVLRSLRDAVREERSG